MNEPRACKKRKVLIGRTCTVSTFDTRRGTRHVRSQVKIVIRPQRPVRVENVLLVAMPNRPR